MQITEASMKIQVEKEGQRSCATCHYKKLECACMNCYCKISWTNSHIGTRYMHLSGRQNSNLHQKAERNLLYAFLDLKKEKINNGRSKYNQSSFKLCHQHLHLCVMSRKLQIFFFFATKLLPWDSNKSFYKSQDASAIEFCIHCLTCQWIYHFLSLLTSYSTNPRYNLLECSSKHIWIILI